MDWSFLDGFDPWRSVLDTLDSYETVITPGSGAILYSGAFDRTDLPRNLHAAAVATALRLDSLDNAKRSYTAANQSQASTADRLYLDAFRASMAYMDEVGPNVVSEPDGKELLGEFAGAVALNRVRSGFRAVSILYRIGFNYEGDAVARQIIEQLAWSIAVRRSESQAELKAIQPQKVIGELKVVHPEAARLYGELSKVAHAGFVQHQQAFDTDEDGEPHVKLAWNRLSKSAHNLLILSDAWVIAFELSQFNYLKARISVVSSEPPEAFADRAFARDIPAIVASIARLESRDRGESE